MADDHYHLTLENVVTTERVAWASTKSDGRPDFYFDGIMFWHETRQHGRYAARVSALPRDGWWHKQECNCPICARKARVAA